MVVFEELVERSHFVTLPLRVPFRGVSEREVVLFDAPTRWSEWAPFLEYGPEESARWLRHAIDFGFGQISARPVREEVEVNATIPSVPADPELIGQLMERYPGCTTVKVKVADGPIVDDAARVAAVRQWFTENTDSVPSIRLDANGGWTVDETLEAIQRIGGPLDYVEQPCRTVAELAQVRQHLQRKGLFVRVAADESIRKSDDPLAAVRDVTPACDVLVLKVPPLQGVDNLLRIAEQGRSVTVSSALDTAVGIGAGLYAAACLPALDDDDGMPVAIQPAGLATGGLFAVDVGRREIRDGKMRVCDLAPDRGVMAECAMPGPRKDWWIERMSRAYEVLHYTSAR